LKAKLKEDGSSYIGYISVTCNSCSHMYTYYTHKEHVIRVVFEYGTKW